MDCIFCKIIEGTIPGTFLVQDEDVVAIRDIQPEAPTHVLVMPRRHLRSVLELEADDAPLAGRLFVVAAQVARQEGIDARGFRLIANTGSDGGQTVDHLHLHVLGGRSLGPLVAHR